MRNRSLIATTLLVLVVAATAAFASSQDIRRNGLIWGEAEGCGSGDGCRRVAAVLYFFSDEF